MYSSERLLKLEVKKNMKDIIVQAISLGDIKSSNNNESKESPARIKSANRPKTVDERLPAFYIRSRSAAKIREAERGIGGYVSQYAHLQQKEDTNTINSLTKTATGKSILRIIFVEKYDLIIAASEDKDIYVWGFDIDALKALHALNNQEDQMNTIAEGMLISFSKKNICFFSVYTEGTDVANRVVGFTLRKILRDHDNLVTSLAVVDDFDTFGRVFLLSAGWDQRIVVWDLTNFTLFSKYSDPESSKMDDISMTANRSIKETQRATVKKIQAAQMAANGSIHDMDYSPYLKFFAYTASDMCVYVRKFSPTGSEMKLMYKLETNLDSEVYCVKWNYITNQWVTGMENGEIRLWVFVISVNE
jgi:WD40 repeat protein